VKRRLVSDVPLGVFLSGGLDSATLVAVIREVSGEQIQTFSIGFEEKSFNELEQARVIAGRFETDHHEEVVRPDLLEIIPALVRSFDEPFADSSSIPVFCLARMARKKVTVALGGDGGDEVFGGYHTYSAYKLAKLYRCLPGLVRRRLIPFLVNRIPVSHGKISFDFKAKRFVMGALLPPEEGHYRYKVAFDEAMKKSLYRVAGQMEDSFRKTRDTFFNCPSPEDLDRLQYVDSKIYLPDDILVKLDRMTMAHSLESRVPLLDHELVEFMARVPAAVRIKRLRKKHLLKKAMAPRLPKSTIEGKKRGFNVPIPSWICGPLNGLVKEVLSESNVNKAGLFSFKSIEALLREHEEKNVDYSRNIWELLMFHLWHREYME
jgi:asparagine synthase (glutamine-hydrolysing)